MSQLSDKPQFTADFVILKAFNKFIFVDEGEIGWIEAHKNYVKVHAKNNVYMVRHNIGALFVKLNPHRFIRIHRSFIANIMHIKEVERCNNGEFIVTLKNGKQIPCSKGYNKNLGQLIKTAI